jgi:KaiC/GvpD/RAD55 family RecA-like ATPase
MKETLDSSGAREENLVSYSSFGISVIDDLLGGGLLTGDNYLLEIEPGTEEMSFVSSFLEAGWQQQESCVVVTYDLPHEELIRRLEEYVGAKGKLSSGSLSILDLWTEAKNDYQMKGPIFMVDKPGDINAMTRMFLELADQIPQRAQTWKFKGIRLVTYSVSSMVINYKLEPSYKWMRRGLELARRLNITTLGILNSKMFDETVVATLEHYHDGIIALSMKELDDRFQRFVTIKKSPIPGFSTLKVPYSIEGGKPRLQKQPD